MKEYTLGLYEKAMPNGLSFEAMLDSAARCGFDTLELSVDETDGRLARLDWDRPQRLALKSASDAAGIPIKTMCLSGHRKFPLGSHDEAVRLRSLEIMRKAVEFASDTGIRLIQLAGYDVYYEEGDRDTVEYFGENLRLCAEYAAAYGILLGFETMETPFMDTVAKSMRWVEEVDSPYLGVYPDIGNLKNASVLYGTDLLADLKTGRGQIMAAHLKATEPGIYRDLDFGQGHTEYEPCIKLLYSMGVRHFTGEFWYKGEADYLETLKFSAKFLREKIEASK